MIGWNLARNTPPIGVDVGRHGVKLAQYDRVGGPDAGRANVIATSRQPLPAGLSSKDEGYHQWVASAMKSALTQGPFIGRRCVSSLPASRVVVKNLRLPTMPADELREAVNWEMRDRVASDAAMTVQFIQAGEVRQGEDTREEIIAMAAETPFVEGHVEALCEAGLAPLAVEVSVSALARAFRGACETGVHLLADVGYESTKLLILRDGRVVFYKRIEVGGQHFSQSVANHLAMPLQDAHELRRSFEIGPEGVDRHDAGHRALFEALRGPTNELSQEIELCLRYFGVTFRGPRPERLLLVGGEAIQPWLATMLEAAGSYAVELGDASDGVAGRSAPGWALALGLAQRPDRGWGERRQSRNRIRSAEGRAAA